MTKEDVGLLFRLRSAFRSFLSSLSLSLDARLSLLGPPRVLFPAVSSVVSRDTSSALQRAAVL